MSAIDYIHEEPEAIESVRAYSEMESEHRERIRRIAYAKHFSIGWRWNRLLARLRGDKVMSYDQWKRCVDRVVEVDLEKL